MPFSIVYNFIQPKLLHMKCHRLPHTISSCESFLKKCLNPDLADLGISLNHPSIKIPAFIGWVFSSWSWHLDMIDKNYKYWEETGRIIGLALEVHKQLGNGFQEVIYQRALEIEFSKNLIPFEREFVMPVLYKGEEIGTRRVDFLLFKKISVELKALIRLEPVHFAQAINYLEAYNIEIGLLLNFGTQSLEVKRLLNKKLSEPGFSWFRDLADRLASICEIHKSAE